MLTLSHKETKQRGEDPEAKEGLGWTGGCGRRGFPTLCLSLSLALCCWSRALLEGNIGEDGACVGLSKPTPASKTQNQREAHSDTSRRSGLLVTSIWAQGLSCGLPTCPTAMHLLFNIQVFLCFLHKRPPQPKGTHPALSLPPRCSRQPSSSQGPPSPPAHHRSPLTPGHPRPPPLPPTLLTPVPPVLPIPVPPALPTPVPLVPPALPTQVPPVAPVPNTPVPPDLPTPVPPVPSVARAFPIPVPPVSPTPVRPVRPALCTSVTPVPRVPLVSPVLPTLVPPVPPAAPTPVSPVPPSPPRLTRSRRPVALATSPAPPPERRVPSRQP